jgi:hypothetical protein
VIPPRFLSFSNDLLCFRLIQWNPATALATNPALPNDSSESNNYSPVPYVERDALRFKEELEETQRELEDVSKKAGIAELEWEHWRKQLLETIDSKIPVIDFDSVQLLKLTAMFCTAAARDAELHQFKMLVKQLADKVNAPRDTPADRLAAVEDRVDEVAVHGIRLGTTLGLAAMAMHTGVDYSIQPRGFPGGAPEDIDEIEVILERLDGHGDAIAELTHSQSVLNRLFD